MKLPTTRQIGAVLLLFAGLASNSSSAIASPPSRLQLEARVGRSFPTADLTNDGYQATELSATTRVGFGIRSRAKHGVRIGAWFELGAPAEIRGRELFSNRRQDFRPYRFRGLALVLSAERQHDRGTSRFEVGHLLTGYAGDQFACSADAGNGLCVAGSHAASELGGSALLLGVTRIGLPGVPHWLGLAIDDRVSWQGSEIRHEIQCGVVALLLGGNP